MPQWNCFRRRGVSTIEVLVAASLLMSVIGVSSSLVSRITKVYQATRHYQIAVNELANQMEVLTILSESEQKNTLKNLSLSPPVAEVLPNAKIEGRIIEDDSGARIVLSIRWERGSNAPPIELVAWLDTMPHAEIPLIVQSTEKDVSL
jgi:Tfp pilus assembly protein PilV